MRVGPRGHPRQLRLPVGHAHADARGGRQGRLVVTRPGAAAAPRAPRTRAQAALTWQAIEATPLGRLGEPADTAGAVAFLCMRSASYVTGQARGPLPTRTAPTGVSRARGAQVISVDGGLAAQGFRGPCVAKRAA